MRTTLMRAMLCLYAHFLCVPICAIRQNLLIMTDSSHFGNNARIVMGSLSPNARIVIPVCAQFSRKKLRLANAHTGIPMRAMINNDQSQFAHYFRAAFTSS